ncbi:hypothetical protein A9Q74_13405 [Colwellia sp. 39_35_sub15_T18]|nr:hypothetical protein A9Q74_13405 [Colwellia sp. 39_35_sub15_T18]
MKNKVVVTWLLAIASIAISAKVVKAETIYCGLKTITVQNGKMTQIRHEDGTIHKLGSDSKYWSYDGKSIKHKLIGERLPCGTNPKSRDEIIDGLSSRFIKNPSIYNMDKQEALWMTSFTANLMKTDKNCHVLVDASKSVVRNDMFYIDCSDHSDKSHRYWVTRGDLKAGNSRPPATAVTKLVAINICSTELRSKAMIPSTYNPALLTGTSSRIVENVGRNIVEINFTAKSAIGVEGKFRGRCVLESGRLIEAIVLDR